MNANEHDLVTAGYERGGFYHRTSLGLAQGKAAAMQAQGSTRNATYIELTQAGWCDHHEAVCILDDLYQQKG